MEDEWAAFLSKNNTLTNDSMSGMNMLNLRQDNESTNPGKAGLKKGSSASLIVAEESDESEFDSDTDLSDDEESKMDSELLNLKKKVGILSLTNLRPQQDVVKKVVDKVVANELKISTNTKVLYLNQEININSVFWKIPITEYWRPMECVIKKQMKIVSNTPEEYEKLTEQLKTIPYYTEKVIKEINNPNARKIKFKDERKITVGISKKDIMNCRGKAKDAFYNCFAMILRFRYGEDFKEIHVKVFNTGKLEIPGILNSTILDTVKRMILEYVQPHLETRLDYLDKEENVLINSDFNCGFFINQKRMHQILRSEKYGITTTYDPCLYPGIKCKYYYSNSVSVEEQTGKLREEDKSNKLVDLLVAKKYTEVSFMIFRTGSVLIVGNCSEQKLRVIYEFIKNMLIAERDEIMVETDETAVKQKNTKIRKKNISISTNYYETVGV